MNIPQLLRDISQRCRRVAGVPARAFQRRLDSVEPLFERPLLSIHIPSPTVGCFAAAMVGAGAAAVTSPAPTTQGEAA